MTVAKMCAVLCVIGAFDQGSNAVASEVPYGADTIPFLVRHSSVIVRVASASPVVTDGMSFQFVVERDAVIRGEIASHFTIAIPNEIGLAGVALPAGSLLFLTRLLSEAEKEDWGIAAPGPVFAVTAGFKGVIPSEPGVEAAVEEYLGLVAADPESREAWARAQLASDSPYLQRSGVLEIAGVGGVHFSASRAADLLLGMVTRDQATTAVRRAALEEFVSADPIGASDTLRDLAADPATPDTLRWDAVIALPRVEGGREVLEDLSGSEDSFLGEAARERVRVLGSPQDNLQPPSPQRLQADEVNSSVVHLLQGGQRLEKKLELLHRISGSQPALAANALQEIILTTSNPPIRYAAFGKLRVLDTPHRKEVLQELLTSLRDKELRVRVLEQLEAIGEAE